MSGRPCSAMRQSPHPRDRAAVQHVSRTDPGTAHNRLPGQLKAQSWPPEVIEVLRSQSVGEHSGQSICCNNSVVSLPSSASRPRMLTCTVDPQTSTSRYRLPVRTDSAGTRPTSQLLTPAGAINT